jgi:uncharacterized protein YegP (UPF0339 family)
MAYHIFENGKKFTFMDYILSESIVPKQTPFGLNDDANDGKVERVDDPTDEIFTLFKENDTNYYKVTVRLDNGEIFLEHSEFYSSNSADYSINRHKNPNAILALNKTFYVALILVQKCGLPQFCFSGLDPALGSVYDRLSQNKFFLRSIFQMGFGYAGKQNGYHIYQKLIE